MKPWIVYGAMHPAFSTEIIGRYRWRFTAWLASVHFVFWTASGDGWAHAWIARDDRVLPTARIHR